MRYVLQHLILLLFFASCTDYHIQFEEIGSPTVGEAMEKQADTERTETTREPVILSMLRLSEESLRLV